MSALRKLARLGASAEALSDSAHNPSTDNPRVLVCTLRSWADHNAYESVIAQSLRIRGCHVSLLTCGGGLPACEEGRAKETFPSPCNWCGWATERLACKSRLPAANLRDNLPWGGDPRLAPAAAPEPLGYDFSPLEAARASAIWQTKVSEPASQPSGSNLLADNAISAFGVFTAAGNVLDQIEPDVVFMVNGLFASDRGIRAAAEHRGIRVVTYELSPRNEALVFSQGGAAPAFNMEAIWEAAKDMPLTADQNSALDHFLEAREEGTSSHEAYRFTEHRPEDSVRSALNVPAHHRLISLFSNLAWDTALSDVESPFKSMLGLVEAAVCSAQDSPATLVVRCHPAEVKWGSGEALQDMVRERVGPLGSNVTVIDAHDPLNSYALLSESDLVLTHSSTIGLEAAVAGKPVAVGSAVHYSARGFTSDLCNGDELAALFRGPLPVMTSQQIALARRYAFAFFFRHMISFPLIKRSQTGQIIKLPVSARALAEGSDPFLDHICGSIISGAGFDLPPELLHEPYLLTR